MTHTKGPWWITQTRKQYVDKRLGEWPEILIQPGETEAKAGNVIATVVMGGPAGTKHDIESIKANARLISAAPDLLEACKVGEIMLRRAIAFAIPAKTGLAVTRIDEMSRVVEQLKSAIAKAEPAKAEERE